MNRPGPPPLHPFLTRDAASLGISRRRVDGPEFRRIFDGVVVASAVPDTVAVRSRGALLVAPVGAAVSHWTAARLWGGIVPDDEWTHVALMRDVRFRVGGIRPHRFRHALDVRWWQGIRVTSPLQTFCHLARHLGLVDLVVLGDSLVRKARFSTADLVAYATSWEGQRRAEAVAAARLVREHVDSRPESTLRLLMVLAGFPEPEVDIRIHDEQGRLLFRIDLGYRNVRIAVEYDGRWHATADQAEHDAARRGHLATSEGWRFIVVTADELYGGTEALLERLTTELVAAGLPCTRSDAWRAHFRVTRIAA